MAYQERRGKFHIAALIGITFAALVGGTTRDAYASPGCDAINFPWQSVDPWMSATNAEIADGKYPIRGFKKGDRIIAKLSTHHMDNQFADPRGYGELALGSIPPGASEGPYIVAPSFGGFTYVVPADTPNTFMFEFDDIGGTDDPDPHFSVTCTNAG